MILERLTKKNIIELKGKRIYCIEKSLTYLDELCDKFPLEEKIKGIIHNSGDENKIIYKDKIIKIYKNNILNKIDYKEVALLITSDYYNEIFEKLEELKYSSMEGIKIYYFLNREAEFNLSYKEKYKEHKLEDIIIFRSGPHQNQYVSGMDFSDNSRALFEYFVREGYNDKYKLVWFVKKPKEYIAYTKIKNVYFIPYDGAISNDEDIRERYYYYFCLAKYIFFTDAYGFARNTRKDQIRIQLWHGCGFKKRLNSTSCKNRYEYMTVTSDLYGEIHSEEFGLEKSQILVTGLAKGDWIFSPLSNWKEELSLKGAKKYIFWLPTYRFKEKKLGEKRDGDLNLETGLPLINTIDRIGELNKLLLSIEAVLIIKLHPFQDKSVLLTDEFSNIKIIDNEDLYSKRIEINQLLGYADGLISDYSSVAIDYMLTDKPIGFIVDDIEEYKSKRGFIFDEIEEWLPGELISNYEEMMKFIDTICQGQDVSFSKRNLLKKKMYKYMDNNNCKRIVESLGIKRS